MQEILHPRKGLQKLLKTTQQNVVIGCSRERQILKISQTCDGEGSPVRREEAELGGGDPV